MRHPRSSWSWATAAALASGLTFAAEPGENVVRPDAARVREVTVYRDRAEVVREARVRLPAGASTVEIAGIPIGVEPDSLRASAEGVPSLLGAVQVVETARAPEETPEWLAAKQEVARVEHELAALGEQHTVDESLRAFLTALQASTATTTSRELGEGRADPAALESVYALLSKRLEELGERRLDRARRKEDLDTALRLAHAQLAALRPAGNIRSRVALVDVETRQPGELTLRLAYVAPNAWWRPSYRATLDAATGEVHLATEGVVRQTTGEDWTGVKLSLSSAAPATGLVPPLLESAVLSPGYVTLESSDGERHASRLQVMKQGGFAALPPAAPVADTAAEMAGTIEAGLERSAYSVVFAVPGASDVPADGRDHRVALRSEKLPGKLLYRVVPGLEPRAYLTSRTTAPADYPLLAGPVRVFTGGAYLGSFPMEEKGPGAELNLPAGVDNRLEVERVRQPPSSGKQGLSGGKIEVEYAFLTKLHNLNDRGIEVVLEDRVPVSQDDRIVVQIDAKRTTGGHEDSPRRPGVKLWTFELAPGARRDIELVYSVTYPRDLAVIGLD